MANEEEPHPIETLLRQVLAKQEEHGRDIRRLLIHAGLWPENAPWSRLGGQHSVEERQHATMGPGTDSTVGDSRGAEKD